MTVSIPALCFGPTFQSVNRTNITDLGSGDVIASLGLVEENRIATDCNRDNLHFKARELLLAIPAQKRVEMCIAAADIFDNETLSCEGVSQSPDDFIDQVSRISGLPLTLTRDTASRVSGAFRKTRAVLDGLTAGMPLEILDKGIGTHHGATVRLVPRIPALGVCLPNNSPGVNVVYLPSVAFGIPVLVRPGSSEPLTPLRVILSLIAAGFPKECFGYYPCDHGGSGRIPELTEGAIVFGSDQTVARYKGNPLVHRHGAGYSKLIIGEDLIDDWESLVDDIADNVANNSGRSCYAVSRIEVPRYADEIAEAVSARLTTVYRPRVRDDAEARLSAMAMPTVAKAIDGSISAGLDEPGARDVTAGYRDGERLIVLDGCTYLQPTMIRCDSREHTLARQEFLFPFSAIVEASNEDSFANLGPTLSLAVYTKDEKLAARARRSHARLVSVGKPTSALDRTQPHEEDLFRLLWNRLSYVE